MVMSDPRGKIAPPKTERQQMAKKTFTVSFEGYTFVEAYDEDHAKQLADEILMDAVHEFAILDVEE